MAGGSLIIYVLAVVKGGGDGLQILSYLTVIILFAGLFFPLRGIVIIFLAHLAAMLYYPSLVLDVTLQNTVDWPISLNFTLAAIMFLITHHRNQLEIDRQARLVQERTAFHIMATATLGAQDIPSLCHLVLSGLVDALQFDMGFVRLYDEENQCLPITAVVGMDLNEAKDKLPVQSLNDEGYLAAYVANKRQPIFAPNADKYPLSPAQKTRLEEMEIGAFISYPLLDAKENPLGVIQLTAHKPREFAKGDQTIFATISEMFTAALEHKHAEEAVRSSEERFRHLAYSLPDTVYILNRATSSVEFMNRREFLGYTQSEFEHLASMSQIVYPDDRARVEEFWEDLMQNQPHAKNEIEYRLKRKGGDWEWIHNRVTILSFDAQGTPKQLLVILTVITERKQMIEAQKMESLGVLAGGVSHDFNNLLAAMLSQTSLALIKMPPESPARSHVEKATNAAERAASLTRQLLAYSGRGHFEIRPINLNALFEENLHLFEVAVPNHVRLHSMLASSLPHIAADIGQMQQVIMNLILNAAEAIGEQNGMITVVTDTQDVGPDDDRYWQHTGTPLTPGQYVTLEVNDNGQGINSETLSNIFNPFFTTKELGRGLGLAAVLGIIRGHNGGLRVYSEVGKGTTFKLFFPASSSEAAPTNENELKNQVDTLVACILVIDDEELIREAAKSILALEGIQAIGAANGADGIVAYQKQASEIDLVLLDLSMPGLSGQETLCELRKIDPEVRVILSSGYSEVDVVQDFTGEKMTGFLQKPYSASALIEMVKQYVE